MTVPVKKILYRDNQYEVPIWIFDELKKYNIKFDDEYIKYLFANANPIFSFSIGTLAVLDLKNRVFIGSKGILGRIVKLDKNGNILDCYETVYEAVVDSIEVKWKYSFEKFIENNIFQKKEKYCFFGVQINVSENSIINNIILELNKVINKCKNKYLDKNKIFKEMYLENLGDVASKITFEEYVDQGIKSNAFSLGQVISQMIDDSHESKYTEHNIEKCEDFNERFNMLLEKYSFKNDCAFKKIDNLNEVKDFFGIYLLVLPQIKGCYVGQTKKSFLTRIKQHFTTPNSIFDVKYKPSDIKEIYILPLLKTVKYNDLIEEDCIAVLGKEICLNALAGGNSNILIKSDLYCENEHFIDNKTLKKVLKEAVNIKI